MVKKILALLKDKIYLDKIYFIIKNLIKKKADFHLLYFV